jgi:CheY-like chemotaxis protein
LNEILDFSRDSVVLDLKEHHPIDLITSALGNALRNNPKADVEIKYELNHQHKSLHVDGARITRIFTNIIDNALEAMFVNHNGKAFGVLKISTEWLDPFLKVTIANNGPSIPEDALPKIFDPFFTQGKEGGHGLGLAICKRVVDMHGGRIKARNKIAGEVTGQQGGVEFIIELLTGNGYAIVNESELIRSSKELEVFRREEAVRIEYGETINTAEFMRINKERGRQSYLLIVDDEPLFRESIRCLFNNLEQVKDHVKIVETDSTEKALAIFEAREFDYVITDIDLGKRKMNGYEFAQLILEKYPNTYVLIHSNKRKDELDEKIRSCVRRHSESDDAQECNSSKFMGFLPKPMKAAELLQFLACKSFETGSARQTKPTMSAKKVLLLNDDDGYNIGMKLTLKTVGIQILTATSVSDALKVLTENKLDGIISDINLGDGKPDGYEFLRGVREKDKTIPFIFASGYPKSDHWPKAEKLGATAYLQNPFETAELKGVLNI